MKLRITRTLLIAVLGSLAIHLALIVYLSMRASQVAVLRDDTAPPAAAPAASSQTPHAHAALQPITPDADTVRRLLDEAAAQVAGQSVEQHLAQLSEKVDRLQRIDVQEVHRMAALIASAAGADRVDRAMSPRAGATGSFDADTASLYDIRRSLDTEGHMAYEHVYVDAAGNTLSHLMPPGQMSESDFTAFRVFELTRQNPNLRPLVDTVRRMVEAQGE